MAGLGNKLRCTLCLEEIDYLENPKQLPCTHVYCLPCLESKVQTVESRGVQVVCSICSKKHALKFLQDLPTPAQEDQSKQGNSIDAVSDASTPVVSSQYADRESATAQCDKCKTKGVDKEAVCYCADCDRKLCNHHNQQHNDFFDDGDGRHRLVEIKKYLAKPGVYTKPKCELHGYDIGVCCEKCFCLRCPRCKTEKECNEGAAHVFHTLEDIEPKLKSEFSDLLKECADKLTQMCKLEKETWFKLDEFEKECEEILERVDTKEKELVAAVIRESAKFKDHVNRCQQKKRIQSEEYLEVMRINRDEIEQTRLKCELLLRNHHVTEIIKQRGESVSDLKEAKSVKLTENEYSVDVLNKTVEKFMELEVELRPDTLQLESTHPASIGYDAVAYTAEGDILAFGDTGLYLHTKSSNYKKSAWILQMFVNSAFLLGSDVWYTTTTGRWEYVKTGVLEYEKTMVVNQQYIFKFKGNQNDVIYMTGCDNWVVVTDPLQGGVIVYNRRNGMKSERTLDFLISNVHFATDGSLLVTGGDTLSKFSLDAEGEMLLSWTSPDLPDAHCIAERKNGHIIVKGGSTLYVLSQEGDLLSSSYYTVLKGAPVDVGFSKDGDSLIIPSANGFTIFSLL